MLHHRFSICLTFVLLGVICSLSTTHGEDLDWIGGGANNDTSPGNVALRYGTNTVPLSWFDTTKWFQDAGTFQSNPNNAIPVDGQSIAFQNSCCNPEPFITIDNGGAGVFLPNSALRFDAKTNIFDSGAGTLAGNTAPAGGSYNFGLVDDGITANTIAFNGAGGAANDVYVPVTADIFTSNRHGAKFHAPITVNEIYATSGHQDRWEINVSPTGAINYVLLDENRGPDGGNIDGDGGGNIEIAADTTVNTLEHVWGRLGIRSGATLTLGTFDLEDYSSNPAPNNNPNQVVIDGAINAESFLFGGVDQGLGTFGGPGSGADNILPGFSGNGLLTVAPAVAPDVPEPTSIAIWTLLGLVLAGYGYRRYRRA